MTSKIRSIAPDMRLGDAEAVFKRFGHGALPVVDAGGVVRGLLSRQALDRALRHGLEDMPVSRYMWHEPPLVAPDTALAELRRLLTDEDSARVGRLLVVDAQMRLLGLITRGDLLRAWAQQDALASAASHPNLGERLERALAPEVAALLREAATIADQQGSTLYVVGGVPRDLLLARPIGDLDLVVEGDAVAVGRELARRHGGQLRSHSQFGTATVSLGDAPLALDFVTARTEFYEAPSALPEVEPASLRHDLHRRDFTINTLALCLGPARYGWLYDFYGGQRDLRKRIIRVLHNLSFVDDPTRLLRAARLAARLEFAIEPRTRALIDDAIEQELLARTTPARIFNELRLLLGEDQPERGMALLDELGLLRAIHPELTWTPQLAERFAALPSTADPTQRQALSLGVLVYAMSDEGRAQLAARLMLNAALARMLRDISALRAKLPWLADPALPPSALDRALRHLDANALAVGQIVEQGTQAGEAIGYYLGALRGQKTVLGGRDLLALGVPEGPQVGVLLDGLRAALLDGELNGEADERAWVRAQLSAAPRP
jgi:tRNA nucleotidyltransferase (CCA-adding enzyme)